MYSVSRSDDTLRLRAKALLLLRQRQALQAVKYVDPDPVHWIETNFYIPETSGPMQLNQFQVAGLREALAVDNGQFRYSTVVWSAIKKSAKCLDLDTRVVMGDGSYKLAQDIQKGDVVQTRSGKGNVLSTEVQPDESLFSIKTNRGREIIISGEHPFLVNGNNIYPSQTHLYKSSIRSPKWITAKELTLGDRVVIGLDYAEENPNVDLDEMYLLGAYIGDGSNCAITTEDPEIKDAFEKRFILTSRGKYSYYIKGSPDWLRKHGLLVGASCDHHNHKNSYTKRVPDAVFCSGRNGIIQFLSGYIDTDGFISNLGRKQPSIGIGGVNFLLLQECQSLFEAIGINATLFRHDSSLYGKRFEAYKLMIYGREQIIKLAKLLKLKVKHKRDKLEAWWETENLRPARKAKGITLYSSDRIVSIERTEPRSSIAIEIDQDHTHITNGLITHNSSIAAAVALWFAWQTPWSSIKIIANDLKQADSRVFFYIRRALVLNKQMGALAQVRNYHITLPNHSTIEAIPIDPKGEAGGNDDLVVYSEIWGWKHEMARQMWTETTLSPLKFGHSLRWCETYAGYVGESPILEGLYDQGVKDGQCIDSDNEFYRNNRLLVIWNTKPTTTWQTPEYYSQEASNLIDTEFNRVHRNQWGTSTSAFIPSEWWDNCRQLIPEEKKLESWIIALDAAVEGDCFGLVGVTRRNGITTVRSIRKWAPPKGGQIMFFAPIGTPIDQDESPAGELRRLVKRHSVVKVVYDPYQLHSFCQKMREELIVFFEEFPQTTKRLLADKALYDSIREQHIAQDGNLDLREHLLNANKQIEGDDKVRIIKRKESLKIDLAVCLSMCNFEAIRMNLG